MWGYIVFAFPFVRSYISSSFRHRVKVFALKFIRLLILKTVWWISFIFGMMVDIQCRSKVFISTISTLGVTLGSRSRASIKRTYDVYYALRLPPDVQIELQRRTADFQNFFCPPEINTRDVQKLSKSPPTFNELYDVCPAYLPEIRYLCWLSFKDVSLSACSSFIDSRVKRHGTLFMAAWSLRVFVTCAELINRCLYN